MTLSRPLKEVEISQGEPEVKDSSHLATYIVIQASVVGRDCNNNKVDKWVEIGRIGQENSLEVASERKVTIQVSECDPDTSPTQAPPPPPKPVCWKNTQWKKLRVFAKSTTSSGWDVPYLRFFDLDGDEIKYKTLSASGSCCSGYMPEQAFDAWDSTVWGGRKDASGQLWLGMETESAVNVGEVRLKQNDQHYANSAIFVQGWAVDGTDESDKWVTIATHNVDPAVYADISISVENRLVPYAYVR